MSEGTWQEAGFDNPPSPQEVRLFIDQALAAEREKARGLVQGLKEAKSWLTDGSIPHPDGNIPDALSAIEAINSALATYHSKGEV
jgi:hypothetical protein